MQVLSGVLPLVTVRTWEPCSRASSCRRVMAGGPGMLRAFPRCQSPTAQICQLLTDRIPQEREALYTGCRHGRSSQQGASRQHTTSNDSPVRPTSSRAATADHSTQRVGERRSGIEPFAEPGCRRYDFMIASTSGWPSWPLQEWTLPRSLDERASRSPTTLRAPLPRDRSRRRGQARRDPHQRARWTRGGGVNLGRLTNTRRPGRPIQGRADEQCALPITCASA